jgi:tRNA(Phe) wybutosine-synthesizing methylase Tyw3
MLLSKEQILSAEDLQSEIVEVPEWGGTVKVRMMTGSERDAFEMSIFKVKGKDTERNFVDLRAKLVARTLINEKGERIFTDDDISALGKKSAKALDRVYQAASRLNGIGKEAVDELTKN